ncbi:phosphatase PAP2 family protein [Microbacterium lushaniae]|uniref:Phosphatase PAP2 family protein n=1 Tax=Microbacterium lushaniae TaxID=2614639 RepID=A0A5J6L671_9MICO|nr:phosphatase PAP2 family protein [Microbacterium lushaniae]QEW03983.1 phosphatase PAP2 family protein [Microbacterium lushaniae]
MRPNPVRTRRLVIGLSAIALACLLGAWIFWQDNAPFAVDTAWNSALVDWPSPALVVFSQVMNVLGGGWIGALIIPLGGAIALMLMRRHWAAAYFLSAEAVSAALVQILKQVFGRARPEEILVMSDYGSFPSGHAANAATLAVIAAILFPRAWVVVAGIVWTLLMAFSRTYLHAHWLSDTTGGALVGAGAALAMAAVFTVPLAREAAAFSAPPRAPAELQGPGA